MKTILRLTLFGLVVVAAASDREGAAPRRGEPEYAGLPGRSLMAEAPNSWVLGTVSSVTVDRRITSGFSIALERCSKSEKVLLHRPRIRRQRRSSTPGWRGAGL